MGRRDFGGAGTGESFEELIGLEGFIKNREPIPFLPHIHQRMAAVVFESLSEDDPARRLQGSQAAVKSGAADVGMANGHEHGVVAAGSGQRQAFLAGGSRLDL